MSFTSPNLHFYPSLILFFFIIASLLPFPCAAQGQAQIPYLDNFNIHNSPSSAFVFEESRYAKVLLVTVPCKSLPRRRRTVYPIQTWTNVTMKAGQPLRVEFGYPSFRGMLKPRRNAFRPTCWIIGPGLPPYPPTGFNGPYERPPVPLPKGVGAITFPLRERRYWKNRVVFTETALRAELVSAVNATEKAVADGVYSFVVTSRERRHLRYYVGMGLEAADVRSPPKGIRLDGTATIDESRIWANGSDVTGLGRFCWRR